MIVVDPKPVIEKTISITLKLGAKLQPNADIQKNNSPANNNDLWLKRTLKAPMSKAKKIPRIDEAVLICPATPTETPNVAPISIKRSPVTITGGATALRAIASERRRSLPENSSSSI